MEPDDTKGNYRYYEPRKGIRVTAGSDAERRCKSLSAGDFLALEHRTDSEGGRMKHLVWRGRALVEDLRTDPEYAPFAMAK